MIHSGNLGSAEVVSSLLRYTIDFFFGITEDATRFEDLENDPRGDDQLHATGATTNRTMKSIIFREGEDGRDEI